MAAYLIYARKEITDPEVSKRYSQQAVPQIREFGGEVLAARGTVHALEGDWYPQSVTILRFEDREALMRWYDSLNTRRSSRCVWTATSATSSSSMRRDYGIELSTPRVIASALHRVARG